MVALSETALPTTDRWDSELAGIALRFGAGRLGQLGAMVREIGGSRALLVVDPGLREAGHIGQAERSLTEAGIEAVVFDGVVPNPNSAVVGAVAELARPHDVDFIVGMGGGSAMDCAKGANFLLTNGGSMEDYWGYDKASRPLLPSIGVPTTAGTGSDAQSYAVIARAGDGRKMACGAPGAAFRGVILDPSLLLSTPIETVAAAGIDAISHALESHVSRTRTEASGRLSAEAWKLLDANFEACFDPDADQTHCRGRMLIGAHLAGAAIEASMLGAAHATANPLTARHGVTHGDAVGLMLPSVIRHNGGSSERLYLELWPEGYESLAERVETLRRLAGLPNRLREFEVPPSSLPQLAELATHEWTGRHNPRPLSERDFLKLYEAAY